MPLKPSAKTVVIVGGGLGGLAAAVQLGRLGVPAVLFDDSAGLHLNLGPHRLFECGAAVTMLRQLDVPINAASRGPNGGLAVWRGRRYTLPVGCCLPLTTVPIRANPKRGIAPPLPSSG